MKLIEEILSPICMSADDDIFLAQCNEMVVIENVEIPVEMLVEKAVHTTIWHHFPRSD